MNEPCSTASVEAARSQSALPPPFPRANAKKLLDTDRITVWDIVWPKGQATAMHRHVYDQVGTYNGNPLVSHVGLVVLEEILTPDAYRHFARIGARLDRLLGQVAEELERLTRRYTSELRGVIDEGRWQGRGNGRFLLLGSASIDLLRLVPLAVLPALAVPLVLVREGRLALGWTNPALWGAVIVFVLAARRVNLLASVAVAVAVVAVLRALA